MHFMVSVVGRPKRVLLGDVPYPTTRELALLLLLERLEVDPDSLRADVITQEGIARGTGAAQSVVSRVITTLEENGLVQPKLGRKLHGRRQVRTYQLTQRGLQEAKSVRERMRSAVLELRFPNGSRERRRLSEIPALLGRRAARYTNVLVAAPRGSLDVASFSEVGAAGSPPAIVGSEIRAPRRFFGRREELGALQCFLDRHGARVFVIWGAPGIGKTTLAIQFALQNPEREFSYVALVPEDTANSLMEKVLRGLSLGIPRPPETLEDVQGALAGFKERWEASRSVLILDQVHALADEARQALASIVRAVGVTSRRGLILISRGRPDVYSRSSVTRGIQVTELCLGRLDMESSRAFAEHGGMAPDQVDLAVRACRGNPLLLSLVAFRGESPSEARANFREYVREEVLSRLPGRKRELLESLAVCDRPVSLPVLGAIRGNIKELVNEGLVQEPTIDRFIMHEEFREAILGTLSAERLARLRRRVADHCLRSPTPDLVEAARFLGMAGKGEAAARVLSSVAHELVEGGRSGDVLPVVLSTIPMLRRRATTAEMLLLLGECHLARGEWGKAELAYQRVQRTAPPSAERFAAESLLGLGTVAVRKGNPEDAEPLLRAALRSFERVGDVRKIARSTYLIAAVMERTGRLDEAWDFASRTRSVAGAAGDVIGEAFGLAAMARVTDRRGDYGTATSLYEQASSRFEEVGAVRDAIRASIGLGGVHCECGHYPLAAGVLEDALRRATEMGDFELQRAALFNLAYVRLGEGDVAAAGELMDRSYEAAKAMGNVSAMVEAQARRGHVALREKRRGDAIARFEEAVSLAGASGATASAAILEKIGWFCLWEREEGLAKRYAGRAAREAKRHGLASGGVKALLAKVGQLRLSRGAARH